MSYVDQGMTPGRVWSIVFVAILHALLGWAFVTGLAYKFVKGVQEDLKTFDVTEEPPPPEEEPPPPAQTVEPARARANLATYISNDDYPASALSREEQGTTRFRLTIGTDGR